VEHLSDFLLHGRPLALPTNIRIGLNCFPGANTIASLSIFVNYGGKESYSFGPSECHILSQWQNKDLDFFSDNVILEQMAILPLRLLSLSETNPDLFKRVQGPML
jgi:hypothetical protein